MLILSPDIVRFESHAWDDCTLIAVDRSSRKVIEDFSDLGPFAQFVDVPEQIVHIKVTRRVRVDDIDDPPLASEGTLRFYLAPVAPTAGRKRVEITCVLTSIRYDVTPTTSPASGVVKTLTFAAFHPESQDPITITPADLMD